MQENVLDERLGHCQSARSARSHDRQVISRLVYTINNCMALFRIIIYIIITFMNCTRTCTVTTGRHSCSIRIMIILLILTHHQKGLNNISISFQKSLKKNVIWTASPSTCVEHAHNLVD